MKLRVNTLELAIFSQFLEKRGVKLGLLARACARVPGSDEFERIQTGS